MVTEKSEVNYLLAIINKMMNHSLPPAKYWRQNAIRQKMLGQVGRVVASTYIRVTATELSLLAPYSYLIVDFGGQRAEMMGAGQQQFKIGDLVRGIWRRITTSDSQGVINYQIKAEPIS